jgi:hypothetical protein
MYGARLLKTIVYNDSREWRPICRSRCLNLTASGRASRCGSAPTAISSSPWKTTGGECERIFVRASKSGSSKVGAIAVWKRKLRTTCPIRRVVTGCVFENLLERPQGFQHFGYKFRFVLRGIRTLRPVKLKFKGFAPQVVNAAIRVANAHTTHHPAIKNVTSNFLASWHDISVNGGYLERLRDDDGHHDLQV